MDQPIGIDLGTTNCAVAHIDAAGRPAILPNADGEPITPSVLCFRDGETLVGAEAKALQRLGEPGIAAFFKRQMGDPSFLVRLGGDTYTATDLSALLLGRLKLDAEAALGRSVRVTNKVLQSRSLGAADLDGVLLVGGSTRMPMVHAFVRERLGHNPMKGVDVDQAVALGAAIVATEQQGRQAGLTPRPRYGLPAPVRMVDVTNHSLGMIALNADRGAYVNAIILPKDSAIPGVETRPFQHPVRGAPADLEVYVTQGESDVPADVAFLGKYLIEGVPPAPGGVQVLDIEYRYDHSGTVVVAARVQAGGQRLEVSVEPLPDDVPARFLGPPRAVEAPLQTTVYLVIDCSGSMDGRPLAEAKKAAHRFVANLDLSHCRVGLLAFHDSTSVVLRACANAKRIRAAVDGLTIGGGTNANPLAEVLTLLQGVDGARFAVVLTDGQWFQQGAAERSARACHQDEIGIVAIGLGDAEGGFLRRIASTDEAGLFTDLSRLVETFESVAQIITRGAGIAPSPAGGRPGTGLSGLLGRLGRGR